jgi:hypothetical protein
MTHKIHIKKKYIPPLPVGFFLYLCRMNVELVKQYLETRYNNLSLIKNKEVYKLGDVFIYEIPKKKLIWYVNVESELLSWFGPGNYYELIHSWFFNRFGEEIGYDK